MKIPRDWTFQSDEVADGFDRHVREQLPWYEIASAAVAHIARSYIPPTGGAVYDLGAATGNIGRLLAPTISARGALFTAIDNSEQMAAAYRGPGVYVVADIAEYEPEPCDVVIANLCFMFLPIARRRAAIDRFCSAIKRGGAMILVERFVQQSSYLGTVLARMTIAGKLAAGVEAGEILDKEISLSGVQRPLSRAELPKNARLVFAFGDFRGYVIEVGP